MVACEKSHIQIPINVDRSKSVTRRLKNYAPGKLCISILLIMKFVSVRQMPINRSVPQYLPETEHTRASSSLYFNEGCAPLFYLTSCNKLYTRMTSVTLGIQPRFCVLIRTNYVEVHFHWIQPYYTTFRLSASCFTLSAHENKSETNLRIASNQKGICVRTTEDTVQAQI
jgi:hypothetical protein